MSRIFLKLYCDYYTFFDLDINNVGTMSRSLYAHNNPDYDDAQALKWQAAQVSAISLTNFAGRFLIGTPYRISLIALLPNFLFEQASFRILPRVYMEHPVLAVLFWLRPYISFLRS